SGFSPSTQVVLRAFQRYGLILADNGADWFFQGTTDDWWGTATGSAVVGELKTIPAAQFDVVDESSLQVAAGSYRASRAAALPQATPSTGTNESDRDYSNLNNASTMAAYYANFKLLMQTAGSFGKPVVVHVEPDLWGYLEQRAAGGDASTVGASVAGSGFAEA